MLTESMTEIGGLMIIAAVSLQLLLALRSLFGRSSHRAQLDGTRVELLEKTTMRIGAPAGRTPDAQPLTWLGKRKFQVAMRMYENANREVCSFYLVPSDMRPIPSFCPGQFLTFELPGSDRGLMIVRSYSLSHSPTERDHYRISVRKLVAADGSPPGLASGYFHDHLQKGDIVETYAPAGEFCLSQDSDRPVVLIAGGVGLTPLLSMLNWLIATRANRQIWLFYGVRNKADHAMYDHLARLRKEYPNVSMFIAYSRPGQACRCGVDYNVDGHITIELLQSVLTASNYEFYLCGPPAMMSTMRNDLAEWGVPDEDVRFEAFQPPSGRSDLRLDPLEDQGVLESFQVKFARSGRVIQWSESADTLLELAEASGVPVRCSCRAGNCGTCLTALRQGTIEYVRPPSREHVDGFCLPCIARPRSDLVIDI